MKHLLTICCLILLTVLALSSVADGSVVTFYSDKTAFDAATTGITTIDFEGIAGGGGWGLPGDPGGLAPSITIGGVTFSTTDELAVSSFNSSITGNPFDSALLFVNRPSNLLATLPTGFSAVGGFFGDIDSAGSLATLTLTGPSGILDTRTLTTADMGAGTPSNFFGWTVSGDTIVDLNYDLHQKWEGIDDFVFGSAVPELTTISIDIKPGSDPNSINLGSNGNIPVVIFSTDTFDATTVDPATIMLADAGVKARGKKGDLMASFEDIDLDGLLDLLIHIDTQSLVLSDDDVEALLTGETFDGLSISGTDAIRIVSSSGGQSADAFTGEDAPLLALRGVPEPGTITLLLCGLAGLLCCRRRK